MKSHIKIIFYIFILIFLSFFKSHSKDLKLDNLPEMKDQRLACQTYFEKISRSNDNTVRNLYSDQAYNDYGFYIELFYDFKKDNWIAKKDKNNNLKIGLIYNHDTASKINSGDSIISINDNKIKSEEEFIKILENENINEFKIILSDKKNPFKQYEAKLIKSYNDYKSVEYIIKSFDISEINIKKGSYDLSIMHNFNYRYNQDYDDNGKEKNHELLNLAIGTLIYYNYDQDRHMYHVCDIPEKLFVQKILLDPGDKILIGNLLKSDRDLETISSKATPYHKLLKNNYNEILISKDKFNVYKIKNDFNLRSFPFDKQFIKFQVIDGAYNLETRVIYNTKFSYKALDKFIAKDDIPGWIKKSYTIGNETFQTSTQYKNTYKDSYVVEIEIERKPGYYIFKVIIPILLILLVCWSSVWVDPKEIESRLTITIVCLLSLIAYNFVIDSELPKLEYLTVLDWIILISYIYAAIPNILSVISFRLLKSNLILGNKIELIGKRYGILSYVLAVLLIIIVNINKNIDHAGSFLSWMKI